MQDNRQFLHPEPPWEPFPDRRRFEAREVHVFRVRLDLPESRGGGADAALSAPRRILSPDERERADRFHFARHRDRFTVGRAALRSILGRRLGEDPRRIRFHYGPRGKPYLKGEPGKSDVRFNVSHSRSLALVALTQCRELGIDVEFMDPSKRGRWASGEGKIPERFFSPREAARLRSLPEALQREGFYACWTRKEAYVKARGGGAVDPPRRIRRVAGARGEGGSPGRRRRPFRGRPLAPGGTETRRGLPGGAGRRGPRLDSQAVAMGGLSLLTGPFSPTCLSSGPYRPRPS